MTGLSKSSNTLEKKAYEIGAKTKELVNKGEEKLKDGVSYLEDEIKARPFVATGTAVMVGFLLGVLFKR